jgi:ribosome-binding factor A
VTEAQIKLKRTESILLQLIPEAIGSLNDNRLHSLDIIEVKCSRGKSDAKVFINPHSLTQEEKNTYLKLLSKARPIIEDHCLKDQGWYRCPKLTFEFDELFQQSQNLEELFKLIAKDKQDES